MVGPAAAAAAAAAQFLPLGSLKRQLLTRTTLRRQDKQAVY